MPLLLIYLIKLSVSLSLMYLFYQVFLRRLTFYKWNRWYLLGYSVVCFFIPLINVTGMLNRKTVSQHKVINWIPSVESFATANTPIPVAESTAFQFGWHWLAIVMATVSLCLVIRLLVQYFSLRRIRQTAQLIRGDDVALYHVALPIAPFSFGNAIFINPEQYSEAELVEIISHEMVHVQQRHSADAVWSEILCILNWYNPFAWLIRKAIRQNLEFIADDHVLRRGMDKKAYQYLLLQTASHRQLAVANSFSLSSLKKRIAMMNKLKTTPVHLLKFLFVLPLLAVILLACRSQMQQRPNDIYYSVIFYDVDTYRTIEFVQINGIYSPKNYTADENGYVTIPYDVNEEKKVHVSVEFAKEGYAKWERRFEHDFKNEGSDAIIELVGLKKGKENNQCNGCRAAMMLASASNKEKIEKEAWAFYKRYKDSKTASVYSKAPEDGQKQNVFWFAGLTLDAATQQPIKGVAVRDKVSGHKTISDSRGFFKMAIPANNKPMNIDATFEISGYEVRSTNVVSVALDKMNESKTSVISFEYLPVKGNAVAGRTHTMSANGEPDFEAVQSKYTVFNETELKHKKIDAIVGNSTKPIWIFDGIPYAIGKGAKAWFDKEEVEDSPQFQVWVEGKVMSMDEANRVVNRFKVNGVGVYSRPDALKKYGVNTNLLLLKTKEVEGDWTDSKHYASL